VSFLTVDFKVIFIGLVLFGGPLQFYIELSSILIVLTHVINNFNHVLMHQLTHHFDRSIYVTGYRQPTITCLIFRNLFISLALN